MPLTLPIRRFAIYEGLELDDPKARFVVACRRLADGERLLRLLEEFRRSEALDQDGNEEMSFFPRLEDVEAVVAFDSVSAAVQKGYIVRSVVIADAEALKVTVLGRIAGSVVQVDAPAELSPPIKILPPEPIAEPPVTEVVP